MSDALLRVLNAPTGDDIAVARMWEQYDFDASEWDADLDSETDSDVTVEYDWEAVHDDNEDGNMLSNDNNAPIVLTFCIDLEMVYTHNNTFWSEQSTICQRNISQLAPRVCAGGERIAAIGRPKMAYPDVEKLINKSKFSMDFIQFYVI